jgi:hypothetical protein
MADYAAKPTKTKEDTAIIELRKRMLADIAIATQGLLNSLLKDDIMDDGYFRITYRKESTFSTNGTKYLDS